jgi:hypothetical protein
MNSATQPDDVTQRQADEAVGKVTGDVVIVLDEKYGARFPPLILPC